MKCRKSKPSRICALNFFAGDNAQVVKLFENKYNLAGIVRRHDVLKYYIVITEARYNTIKNRVAYPDRFKNADSSYRAKIITGYSEANEFKYVVQSKSKEFIFYIYELPVINLAQSVIDDPVEVVDKAFDDLIKDKDLIDQFMHRIQETFKDIIADAYNRGYESGYNDGMLTSM